MEESRPSDDRPQAEDAARGGADDGSDMTLDPGVGGASGAVPPGLTNRDALETMAAPAGAGAAGTPTASPHADPEATCFLPGPAADPEATCFLPGAAADPDATCALPAPRLPADPQATVDLGPGGTGSAPSLVVRDSATGGSSIGGPAAQRVPGQPWVEGYVIEGELGRGGMGVVYKARQPKLRRTVAIKMIRAAGLASEEHVARFYAEARAVAALQHVNIVQIHDIGESETLPYYSLEFVPGSSLDKKLAKQPQPPLEAAAMVETLARAMHYAHQHGIVHRDLKPANVLLSEEGVPKITDFGLAKDTGEDSGMSRDGQAMGTPSYMPPEQARGDLAQLGPKADVYALGAILYEMLVGRPPFLGANAYDTLLQVLKNDPIAPSQLVPRLPKDVETICLKCLEKDPAKRYASAADLADDCRRYIEGEPILSRPISAPERAWRWCKRNPRMASLIAAVAGLLVTVAVGSSVAAMVILAERDAKEVQRKAAVKAQGLAELHERVAKENEETARRNEETARKEREIATEQSQLAFESLKTVIVDIHSQLDDAPRTLKLKQQLLDTAIGSLDAVQKVSDRAEMDRAESVDATLQMAYAQLAENWQKMGEMDKAIEANERCLAMARERSAAKTAEKGEHDGSRLNVAAVAANLGNMKMLHQRDPAAALELLDESMRICLELKGKERSAGEGAGVITEQQLDALVDEARSMIGFLNYLQGDPAAAAPLFREALAARRAGVAANPDDRDAEQALGRSLKAVGETAYLLGDRDGGFRLYDECVALERELVDRNPGVPELEFDLAITEGDYGDLFIREGDADGARVRYDRSVEMLRRLSEQDPENAGIIEQLGLAWYRRGQLARTEADAALAADCFGRSLEIRRLLAGADPTNISWRMSLMLSLARAGERGEAESVAATLPTVHGDRELLLSIAKAFSIAAGDTTGDESAGYAERALATIGKAIAAGFRDAKILRTDPDLAPIRDDARYRDLVEEAARADATPAAAAD